MSSRLMVGLLAAALGLAAAPADAQDWRTVSSRRQAAGEEHLDVHVTFGAGELRIEPAESGTLYRSSIRYDARMFTPIHEFANGALSLGVESSGSGFKANIREGGRMDLALGPDVPLDLDLEFGAVEAEIELGGLRITSAEISTGASDSRIRFARPNPARMRRLTIEAGAAALRVDGLGNANVETVEVEGGVGDITLDFTGDWRGDMRVAAELGLGSLTLRIPRGVGVSVTKDTFLMGFDSQGLVKRGDVYYSTDWESAEHRLMLDVEGAFGSIDIRWVRSNDVL